MKGLFRNDLYTMGANAKVFLRFLLIFGLFAVAVVSQSTQIGFCMISMVGFPACALAAMKREYASKWGKYKLTLPVRRSAIVKSQFLCQLFWLLVGTVIAGVETGLSWLLHGCPFDFPRDILSMFALGISMSLFAGAIFFPLFYLAGPEKSEVFLLIAHLCAFALDFAIISLLQDLFPPPTPTGFLLLGWAVLTGCGLLSFALSCAVTVAIFQRKEY